MEAWRAFAEEAYAANWFTNFGGLSRRLEAVLAERWGFADTVCVAASSGTAAIAAPLFAADITGPVIAPAFTFAATVSAIRMAGAQPVLVDVDPETWRVAPDVLDAALARTGAGAAVLVCPFGLKSEWSAHIDVARSHGAVLVIDNAAGLGVERRPVESNPHVFEAYSMHATKPFAIGEGGVVFAHASMENALRGALNFGSAVYDKPGAPAWGTNGKLPEMSAAIGLAMERMLGDCIAKRRAFVARYLGRIGARRELQFSGAALEDCCWQMLPVLMPHSGGAALVVELAMRRGMEVRRYYRPALSTLPGFRGAHCPVAEDLAERMVCLPVYSDATPAEAAEMVDIADDATRRAVEGA